MSGKSIFLYVDGADYAAMFFEKKCNPQKVYKEMIKEGITKKELTKDGYFFDVAILEFDDVDDKFVSFILNELCDEDTLKDRCIYKIK